MIKLILVILLSMMAGIANAAENTHFKIGPAVEYMDLKQIDANDPFAPRDKGFLVGAKASAGWASPNNGLEIKGSIKYMTTVGDSVTYDGSGSLDNGDIVPVEDLKSEYDLFDIDATIGYRFDFQTDSNKFSVAPFVGYKYWKWDNVLDPNDENINEISTTKGFFYGIDLTSGKFYARFGVISPDSINIEFNIPGEKFPDTSLGKRTSYNLLAGYNFSPNWSIEGYYNRYKSGSGFDDGDFIKTPVDINTYGVTLAYRW